MRKLAALFATLLTFSVYAQKLPPVNFNHLYVVIDSADLSALQGSPFFTQQFGATETRTTHVKGGVHWTGTYLYGLDNYLEIFGSKGFNEPVGNSGVGFSVDGIGEIDVLKTILSKKFTIDTLLREKQMDDGRRIPWFNSIGVKDAVFDSLSHISYWVMEYKPEYFDYYHWKHDGRKLTRTTYLSHHAAARKGKLLRRFTGATFKATGMERTAWIKFLLACGYKRVGKHGYASPENFVITFAAKTANDRSSLASLDFEATRARRGNMKIGPHVALDFRGMRGTMRFE